MITSHYLIWDRTVSWSFPFGLIVQVAEFFCTLSCGHAFSRETAVTNHRVDANLTSFLQDFSGIPNLQLMQTTVPSYGGPQRDGGRQGNRRVWPYVFQTRIKSWYWCLICTVIIILVLFFLAELSDLKMGSRLAVRNSFYYVYLWLFVRRDAILHNGRLTIGIGHRVFNRRVVRPRSLIIQCGCSKWCGSEFCGSGKTAYFGRLLQGLRQVCMVWCQTFLDHVQVVDTFYVLRITWILATD